MINNILLFFFEFYYQIKLYFEVRSVFKLIIENPVIRTKYRQSDQNGNVSEFPKLSNLGVLYMFIPIPKDLIPTMYEDFLNGYLQLLNEAFMDAEMYGLIKMNYRTYLVEGKNIIFIKYIPVFTISAFIRTLITTISLIFLIIYSFKHFL